MALWSIDRLGSLREGRKPLHLVSAEDTVEQTYKIASAKEADALAALVETLLGAKADVNSTDEVRCMVIGTS